eukprot:gene12834-15069_t
MTLASKKQENKKQPTLSRFLITINTNQKDEKYIPLLRESYQHFYDNIQDYLKFVGGIDKRTAMKQVHSYEGDCDSTGSDKDTIICDALELKSIHLDINCIKEEKVSLSTLQEGLQLHLPSLTIIAEFNQVYVLCPTADLQDQYAFLDKKDNATTLYITHLKEHSVKTAYELGRGFSNEREFKEYLGISCRDFQVMRMNLTAKNKDPHITFKSILCPCFTIQ